MDLAPDGKRFAVFPMPEAATEDKGAAHVTFLPEFLRRAAKAEISDNALNYDVSAG